MEIINLKPEHIEIFIEFIENNKTDLNFFLPHKMDCDTIHNILTNNKSDQYKIIIHNDKIIGYGLLRGWDEGYDIPSLGIMVDKNYRGIGVSKLLMLYLEVTAKILGSKKMRIVVHKNNNIAYNLYNKLKYDFSPYGDDHLISFKTI